MANSNSYSPFHVAGAFHSDDDESDYMLFEGTTEIGFDPFNTNFQQPHNPSRHDTGEIPLSNDFFEQGPNFLSHDHRVAPEDGHLRESSPFHRPIDRSGNNPFVFDDYSNERPSSFQFQEQMDPQLVDPSVPVSPFTFTKPEVPAFENVRAEHSSQPSFMSPPPMSATGMDSSLISDHWTDTSPIRTERGDRMDDMCDADKYLHNGLEDIDHALQFHFSGRQFPRHVSKRAKELFRRSYELQSQQKDGDVAFRRNRGDVSRRKRFARRKAFVVTAIVVALKEFGLSLNGRMRQSDSQAIAALSDTVPGGSKIRLTSVKSCCRTLSLTDIRFR